MGRPADIVLRPASGYVADFVAHLNPLSVLKAGDAATPGGQGPAALALDAPLAEALTLCAGGLDPVPLAAERGLPATASVTGAALLRALAGRL